MELRTEYEPDVVEDGRIGNARAGPASWRPISLYPWATRQAAIRFFAFLCIALISLATIADAVADLERAAKTGMRGAMIWGSPPEDRPYSSEEYEPSWSAAEALELPISLHLITGHGRESRDTANKDSGTWYLTAIHEVQRSISTLIFAGVLERHPGLRLVSAENDAGWIPHFIYRMDHAHEKYVAGGARALPQKPGDYVRRQLYATFQDDPVGPQTYQLFGEDNYMSSRDHPAEMMD